MTPTRTVTTAPIVDSIVERIGDEVLAVHADDVDAKARFPIEAITAMRQHGLLSAYVPISHGGLGVDFQTLCSISEKLGGHCASSAMIFAMHQIQVACLVHHAGNTVYESELLRNIADHQLLLASATTEIGTGGDLGTSICAAVSNADGSRVRIDKMAPVISYGSQADAIMVTARRHPEATGNDQVHVLVEKKDVSLDPISTWDSLGFRGTCSLGYHLIAEVPIEHLQPVPFSQILSQTMQPAAHLLWGSLWMGLAHDSASIARRAVRASAKKAEVPLTTQLRLAELDEALFKMRSTLHDAIGRYQDIISTKSWQKTNAFSFGIAMNNIKLVCSEAVVDIVSKALVITGINGYRNDHESALGRHLRDAYGAMLMVNNDRIRSHNASMQLAQR
jgi:acyl-CoA dehydrogenase